MLELRNRLRYFVRGGTTDLAAVNEAMVLNPYLSAGYISLKPDSVVLDIGANIGDFTVPAAAMCPNGRVTAIEPVAEFVRIIEINRILNRVSNIEIVAASVGASEGEIAIHLSGTQSSIYFKSDNPEQMVPLTTLPKLMQDYGISQIDLLKLDCEGAEWDIFPASRAILDQVEQICMELHPRDGWDGERLAVWLREAGFRVWYTHAG